MGARIPPSAVVREVEEKLAEILGRNLSAKGKDIVAKEAAKKGAKESSEDIASTLAERISSTPGALEPPTSVVPSGTVTPPIESYRMDQARRAAAREEFSSNRPGLVPVTEETPASRYMEDRARRSAARSEHEANRPGLVPQSKETPTDRYLEDQTRRSAAKAEHYDRRRRSELAERIRKDRDSSPSMSEDYESSLNLNTFPEHRRKPDSRIFGPWEVGLMAAPSVFAGGLYGYHGLTSSPEAADAARKYVAGEGEAIKPTPPAEATPPAAATPEESSQPEETSQPEAPEEKPKDSFEKAADAAASAGGPIKASTAGQVYTSIRRDAADTTEFRNNIYRLDREAILRFGSEVPDYQKQDMEAWRAKKQEIWDLYEESKSRLEWGQLADIFGQIVVQWLAGAEGLRTGRNMSGVRFNFSDWSKRFDNLLRETESKIKSVESDQEAERRQIEAINDRIDRWRASRDQAASQYAQARLESDKHRLSEEGADRRAALQARTSLEAARIGANARAARDAAKREMGDPATIRAFYKEASNKRKGIAKALNLIEGKSSLKKNSSEDIAFRTALKDAGVVLGDELAKDDESGFLWFNKNLNETKRRLREELVAAEEEETFYRNAAERAGLIPARGAGGAAEASAPEPSAAPADDGTVRVVLANGKSGRVPRDRVEEFLKKNPGSRVVE